MSLDDVFSIKPVVPEKNFPGSRPLRDIEAIDHKPSEVEGNEDWDASPMTLIGPSGVAMEFFRIGALADALGRTTVTIRSWEAKGWLPLSKYRLPNPRGGGVPGKTARGQRLYTRQQVLVVIAAAKQCGVMTDMGRNADWKLFARTVFAGWTSAS